MKLITKSEFESFTTYENFDWWVEKIDYKNKRVLVKVTSNKKQLYLDMHCRYSTSEWIKKFFNLTKEDLE